MPIPLGGGNVPGIHIGEGFIPLYGGSDGLRNVWALLNLIMCIVGIVLGIVTGSHTLAVSKYERDESKNGDVLEDEEDDRKDYNKRRMIWFIITFTMAIAGIVVFMLTEDMRLPMVLVDRWTIVNALILAVEILAVIFCLKRKDHINDKEEEDRGLAIDRGLAAMLEDHQQAGVSIQ